jgi:hypothetical protein
VNRGADASVDCSLLTDHSPLRGDGAIAQLGERVLCKHEVVGSIPSGSTIVGGRTAGDGRRKGSGPVFDFEDSDEIISFGAFEGDASGMAAASSLRRRVGGPSGRHGGYLSSVVRSLSSDI